MTKIYIFYIWYLSVTFIRFLDLRQRIYVSNVAVFSVDYLLWII